MRAFRTSLVALLVLSAVCVRAQQPAPQQPAADEPVDERGFVNDETRLSLSFTQGSNQYYDYRDLRIYLAQQAHYGFKGDDYLDLNVLINRLDRSYNSPAYVDEPITNIFDMDLNYVFGGGDKNTYGLHPVAGVSLFSTQLFSAINFGVGGGGYYNYRGGSVRLLGGVGRNLGYTDDWTPLAEVNWTHNLPLGKQWRLASSMDLMWNSGRHQLNPDDLAYPDTIYVLNGSLYYQLLKNWSLYLRYFNDNATDAARSSLSLGVSHTFRRPAPRR